MGGKLIDEGGDDLLTWYLKNVQTSRGANELYLGLYLNTTEPVQSATLASGLTELSLAGYTRIPLLDVDWTIASQIGTNLEKTFTATVDWGNIYGYFICNIISGTAGELIFVEHFSTGPFNVLDTKTIDIIPKIAAASN